MKPTLLLLCMLCAAAPNMQAQVWKEISIPTRVADASKKNLLADLYASDQSKARPVILIQTPYNKQFYRLSLNSNQSSSGASVPYDTSKYVYVIVDWRGFYANKLATLAAYNRGLDGYDIVEWIAQQKWCNGKVGTWGGSALGNIQFLTAAEKPPHLVCAAPFIKDFKTKYEDYYYGGDFRREHVEALEYLGFLEADSILTHPTLDLTWKLVEQKSDISSKIAIPLFMCSGWFDHFPDDVIRAFADMQEKSDPTVRSRHKLMMGPFTHTGIGSSTQGVLSYAGVEGVPTQLGMKFFDRYLNNDLSNGWDDLAAVQYYQMGENIWKSLPSWDKRAMQFDTLFFHENHYMSNVSPWLTKKLTLPDTVISNPRSPVPTIGGSRFKPSDKTIAMGPQEIQSLLSRPDVRYYQSDSLSEDLVIWGESFLELLLSNSSPDADISVRLCDVYPDGRWIILTQGIQRLRLRNSLSTEQLMPPGEIQNVKLHLNAIAQTFTKGHRVGLVLSASNYPMFDLNLNNGKALYSSGDTTVSFLAIQRSYDKVSSFIYSTPFSSTSAVPFSDDLSSSMSIQPNPSNTSASVLFSVSSPSIVSLEVFDVLSRSLVNISAQPFEVGQHRITFETENMGASSVFVRLSVNGNKCTRVLHIAR